MNLNPNDFMYWFTDHLDRSQAQIILSDVISRAVQYPGMIINFSCPNGGGNYLIFSVRMIIKDYSALQLMQKALRSRSMTIQNALWTDGAIVEKGALCIVGSQTVGVIAVRDVVVIEAGAEEATETIDTRKFKH